jgi:predicted RNA-binding protein with TRAM domain
MNTAEATEESVAKSEYDKLLIKVKKLEMDKQELEAFKIDIWAALDDQTRKEVENKLYPDTSKEDKQTDTPEDNKGIVSSCTITPNVETVKVGQQYTFKVTGYKGKGEWKVDGFEIKGPKDQLEVKVVALKTNNTVAVISYTPEGGEKVLKECKYK